ncbi:hypothetical protein [Microbacterium sp.]|uniref:hypothetical protein n=1 Tax=Microbacterium sp. TaxID=51671 RepID=UPI0027360741|nr:hypothetical protein [Microbacterium sp.]MDP3950400.1 hypothetical protein [Microbacterium sp.]
MSALTSRRILSGLIGTTLLATVLFLPATPTTDAVFVDSEYGTAQVTAATLFPPVIVDTPLCQRPPVTGSGNLFTIRWTWPSATPPYSTFTAGTNVRWKIGTTDGVVVASTGPDANGRYSTTFSSGIVGGIVGGLLGVNIPIEMRTVTQNWTSTRVTRMVYNAPLGAGVSCTITNG